MNGKLNGRSVSYSFEGSIFSGMMSIMFFMIKQVAEVGHDIGGKRRFRYG